MVSKAAKRSADLPRQKSPENPRPAMETTKAGREECGAPQSKWIVLRVQVSGVGATDETDLRRLRKSYGAGSLKTKRRVGRP